MLASIWKLLFYVKKIQKIQKKNLKNPKKLENYYLSKYNSFLIQIFIRN